MNITIICCDMIKIKNHNNMVKMSGKYLIKICNYIEKYYENNKNIGDTY